MCICGEDQTSRRWGESWFGHAEDAPPSVFMILSSAKTLKSLYNPLFPSLSHRSHPAAILKIFPLSLPPPPPHALLTEGNLQPTP